MTPGCGAVRRSIRRLTDWRGFPYAIGLWALAWGAVGWRRDGLSGALFTAAASLVPVAWVVMVDIDTALGDLQRNLTRASAHVDSAAGHLDAIHGQLESMDDHLAHAQGHLRRLGRVLRQYKGDGPS